MWVILLSPSVHYSHLAVPSSYVSVGTHKKYGLLSVLHFDLPFLATS